MTPKADAPTAEPFLPDGASLRALRKAAKECRGCDLYRDATQTVFGKGATNAGLMLVGEQPGDREDLDGEPFVGPAGRVLAAALAEAGIERDEVYLTNAVKHFKWKAGRGKRRLHQRPSAVEVRACAPWLEAEIAAVEPELVVALGATAAKALLGPGFRVTRDRGAIVETDLGAVTATVHPSSLLRIDDSTEREEAREEFIGDLAAAAGRLSG